MITYHFETSTKIELDGYPRFLSVKKTYKETEYYDELTDLIFTTIPKIKIVRDRKDYIKEIKTKKPKNKIYEINYRVYLEMKIVNYSNSPVERIIGENANEESVNL